MVSTSKQAGGQTTKTQKAKAKPKRKTPSERKGGKRKPPHRPRKLTEERRKTILRILAEGNPIGTAANAAGVRPETVRSWIIDGARRDELLGGNIEKSSEEIRELVTFSREARKTIAEASTKLASYVRTHKDWKAQAWLLERMDKETFRLTDKVEVALTTSGVDLSNLDDGELDQLMALAKKAQGIDPGA